MVLNFFSKIFNILMLLVILVNIQQRRYTHAPRKRLATLLFAAWYMVLFTLMIIRDALHMPDWIDWMVVVVGIVALFLLRRKIFPFRLHCEKCGAKLGFDEWIGNDDNLCADCFYEKYPDEKPEEKKLPPTEEEVQEEMKNAKNVSEIDWDRWEPDERCVLCYVTDRTNGKILLIEKKRGMGTGLINGPGGHIELEETAREAAIRETREETGYDVTDLEERGILRFQFADGLSMVGYVFFTSSYSGEMVESTDETVPFWCDLDKIDYSRMWKDDSIWLGPALEGHSFDGRFIFDGQELIDSKVVFDEREIC